MSFVHPAFLWGLLAVAIPIIIHLFQFRRYRTLQFSDTRFIEELQTEQKRQSQLKKLIILTLRVLAIIAVVLGLCVIAWMSLPVFHSPIHTYLTIVFGTTTIFLVGFVLTKLFKGKKDE